MLISSVALVLVGIVVLITGHPEAGEEVRQRLQRRKAGAEAEGFPPPCTILPISYITHHTSYINIILILILDGSTMVESLTTKDKTKQKVVVIGAKPQQPHLPRQSTPVNLEVRSVNDALP